MKAETRSSMTAEPTRRSPYQGLIPYGEDDAPFFFGREKETRLIIANLFASSLTLLYGASGVGKSSVLRAGVANQLRPREDVLVVAFNSWQSDPLVDLKAALAKAAARVNKGVPLAISDDTPLDEYFAAHAAKLGRRLMIILDQFEEYFLYHPQDDRFGAEFPKAVMRTDMPVSFLISLREDSLASLDRFEGRIPTLFDNYLRIEHLNSLAARAAIEKPIEHYNRLYESDGKPMSIEPGLADEVLSQVEAGQVLLGDAGRGAVKDKTAETQIETPYLQLVMVRLWNEEMKAGSRVLRLQTLNALGGAKRIVRTHLDAAIGALPTKEQNVAARIFHYLVTPSGTKIAHTARDLAEYAEMPQAEISSVLEDLSSGDVRILRSVDPPPDQPSKPRYEIFHDVLASSILDWRTRYMLERVRERARRKRRLIGAAVLAALAIVAALGVYQHMQTLAEAEKDRRNLLAEKQKEEEKREQFEDDYGEALLTYQKTVSLLEDLSSEDPEEVKVAVENIKRLSAEGRLPTALAPVIKELIEEKDPSQTREVYKALAEAEKNSTTTTATQEDISQLVPIVFIHIVDEADRPNGQKLEAQLDKAGLSIPGIEKVNRGPKARQLRYFRKGDEAEATALVNTLNNSGWGNVALTYVRGYENTQVIRPRQYEFWFEDKRNPIITQTPNPTPTPHDQTVESSSYDEKRSIIVAGSFDEQRLAQERLGLLRQNGFSDAVIKKLSNNSSSEQGTWRVRLGPYTTAEARSRLSRVRSIVPDAYLRVLAKSESE